MGLTHVHTDNETIFIVYDFDALQCIIDALTYERYELIVQRTELVAHWENYTYEVLKTREKRFLQTFEYALADLDSDIAKFTALQYESAS